MLTDCAFEEVADGPGPGRAIAGPADRVAGGPEVLRIRLDRDAHADVVRDTAEYRIVWRNPSRFSRISPRSSMLRIFEPLEPGDEIRDEQRVVVGQRRDEFGVDGEVMGRRMAGAAGPAVAVEGLLEEYTAALFDERLIC